MRIAVISVLAVFSAIAACKTTVHESGSGLEGAKNSASSSNPAGGGQFTSASHFYCAQRSPSVNRGWILEDGYVAVMNHQHFLKVSLGRGILNEDGDGTANDGMFFEAERLAEDMREKASSAQWKNAAPFLLPNSKDMPGAKAVLYIDETAFTVPMPDFKARLKITSGGKEENIIMACNRV